MGMNWGWIEIVFVAVVALGIGFWQLWSVNREIARDKKKAAAARAAAEPGSAEPAGHAVGEHPLDDR
jgi:hypothetical protein